MKNQEITYRKKLEHPFVIEPQLACLEKTINEAGGKSILVGGCVRDHLLGHASKDIDLEVYGLDEKTLEKVLNKKFLVVAVGKSFGVFKVTVTVDNQKMTFDVAMPRTENKAGQGHKGFIIATDPNMSFFDASKRRDFTINAMGIDLKSMELLDPHGGEQDLKNKVLRHVSNAFGEDALRVLRAAQFCARFDFELEETTRVLCQSLKEELFLLSKERIFEEFKKLLWAKKPSVGLLVLKDTLAIDLFLELKTLIGCLQDPMWHPEGDVWTHTLMVVDKAAQIIARHDLDGDAKSAVMLGALCHDFGKPSTTFEKDGRIKSPGHESAGEKPTRKFLNDIGCPLKLHDDIVSLVKEHLKPHQLYQKRDEVSDGAIRRLCTRVNVEYLLMVSEADFLGRTTADAINGFDPSVAWLKQKIKDVIGQEISIKPIIFGRHLISLGMKPGKKFAQILSDAFEAQLDGKIIDESSGLEWLRNYLKNNRA